MDDAVVAVVLGAIQGALEWLPVSSEGATAVAVSALAGSSPAVATQFGLFLHAGTALSALAYYRESVAEVLRSAAEWRPRTAFAEDTADLSFLALATLATGVTGIPALIMLEEAVSGLETGTFLAVIGGLLVLTGLLQRFAAAVSLEQRATPDWVDALLVGALQGLAVLPGVSRSGTTVSALLLRGHEGESTLRLSFLLSIPAALAANAIVVLDDGIPAIDPGPAVLALAVSAVVGYLTVDALVRLVRRVPFWAVCVGFGALGMIGGLLVI
ncbi:undecaprenyl-diphosphate phosphatase [Halomicrobium salinisoli]|uniref:undecaprenyl-diphosphate phosphatase n=1 Tax=Halomicrobium salinisoli TaxID=2878391 RepID=UPI001CF00934|nr:undecaprenyl-diphosphate phosphatase [Halomicrobium salinisoli]